MKNTIGKTKKTILSCNTYFQINSAHRMIENFFGMFQEAVTEKDSLVTLLRKRIKVIQDYGLTLEGDRCMTVGNEDEPVKAGTVQEFMDWDKEHQHFLPLVKYDGDDTVYLCMGIVLPLDVEKLEELNKMNYKDRWNSVCRPHATMSK